MGSNETVSEIEIDISRPCPPLPLQESVTLLETRQWLLAQAVHMFVADSGHAHQRPSPSTAFVDTSSLHAPIVDCSRHVDEVLGLL